MKLGMSGVNNIFVKLRTFYGSLSNSGCDQKS